MIAADDDLKGATNLQVLRLILVGIPKVQLLNTETQYLFIAKTSLSCLLNIEFGTPGKLWVPPITCVFYLFVLMS